MIRRLLFMVSFVVLVVVNSSQAEVKTGKSQTVYVSAYSHVYSGDRALPFNLAVTLVIRNTDPKSSINVTSVDYFDDKGKLVRHMIDSPLHVVPMASTSFFIKESDTSGGIGANFIVRWRADKEVNVPIVESVMIGARGGQGISFIGSSQEISE